MKKFYATITPRNGEGKQFEIGAYSKKELQKDLTKVHRTGRADLDRCAVHIYTVELAGA